MGLINFVRVAHETIAVTKEGYYQVEGKRIDLLCEQIEDFSKVLAYSPEAIAVDEVKLALSHRQMDMPQGKTEIAVIDSDSFEAAKGEKSPLVMNFANAHCPGGGFLMGAAAQEEALCRCSTLYASLTSKEAKKMYFYNTTHLSPVDSDYMLLSPHVCVFRNRQCELLIEPYVVGVVTAPAPNKYGKAALTSEKVIEQAMKERIRKLFLMAAKNGFQTLVLGAWGCGAFGHNPHHVAKYFYDILVEENYQQYFHKVIFAILHSKKNFAAFQGQFSNCMNQ